MDPVHIEPRRHFLKIAGVGALAASAPALSQPAKAATTTTPAKAAASTKQTASKPTDPLPPIEQPRQKNDKKLEQTKMPAPVGPDGRVGYAVVGLGRLTLEQILPAMGKSKRAKVTALVSGNLEKAARVAKMYGVPEGSIYSYEQMDQLKNNPDVHAVYVVTPPSLHLQHTVAAAQAGKHVLCEKPMATSVADAEKMVAACAEAGVKLMIGYRIQYEPHHREVMRWVRSKDVIGDVKMLQLENAHQAAKDNITHWRLKKAIAGGGPLPDVGIYCFNTARFLLGEEPTSVTASTYTTPGDPRFKEVEETVSWTMSFPSGVIATCVTSYGTADTKRYRVLGTTGTAQMDPAFPYQGLKLSRTRTAEDTQLAASGTEELNAPDVDQFALELDHFAMCVVDDVKPYTPGEEGVQDMRIIAAIYEAARTKAPVALPPHKGLDVFRGPPPKKD